MKKKILKVILRWFDVPVCYKMKIDGVLVVPPDSIVIGTECVIPNGVIQTDTAIWAPDGMVVKGAGCVIENNTIDGVLFEGLKA